MLFTKEGFTGCGLLHKFQFFWDWKKSTFECLASFEKALAWALTVVFQDSRDESTMCLPYSVQAFREERESGDYYEVMHSGDAELRWGSLAYGC